MSAVLNTPKYAHLKDIDRIQLHAERICAAMEVGWSLDPRHADNHWMRQLVKHSGERINIALKRGPSNKPFRLEISGAYPYERPYDLKDKAQDISVNEERDEKDIVKEIERRLMPEYLEVYHACLMKHATDTLYKEKKKELYRAALAAVGEEEGHKQLEEDKFHLSSDNCDLYGHVRVTSDHSYEINLSSVPVKAALAILSILKEFKKE